MQERDESSPDAADEGNAPDNPDATSSDPQNETAVAGESVEESENPETGATDEDGLPEWEPLTPELVEDEAIRGDFMLRWASILLALLMGWTIIQDTSVLVHIKTGQYLASHGVFPPSTDVFSYSADDRQWVNLAWLWDLLLAGVYGIGGATGVSILKALLAAVTFWLLSRISLPGLPTWWGSVCAVLALVAAFPSLNATPAIVTLLGMSCLMWLLHRWTVAPESRSLWPVVALLWGWCQFDDRAWIGAVVLIGFTIGYWIDSQRNLEESKPAGVKALALVVGGGLLAMLVHPFFWETLLSPLGLYGLEYPSLQQYASNDLPFLYEIFPLWSVEFWEDMNYFNAAGLLLWLITVVTLVLNRDRLKYSQLGAFLVMTVIGFAGGRELAAAGIVNAALASLNAQQWYLANFRQTYSIEMSELLFSRGGRALTVVVFFAMGFAMVSGHLTGAEGRRVGLGLDPQLEETIASYRNLLEDSYDDRPFHFRLAQGNVLIWIGQKPFIDNRLRLFAGGKPSLVEQHQSLRLSLRPSLWESDDEATAAENRRLWQTAFDHYGITHVLPRLSGIQPDYASMRDLNQSADWTLTRLGAATAVFYRVDSSATELQEYVTEHDATDLVSNIMRSREEVEPPPQRVDWPRPPTIYEQYLYQPNQLTPNVLQEGRHYSSLPRQGVIEATRNNSVTAAYAAIRRMHVGLADHPNNSMAYHILGESYQLLRQVERFVMDERNTSPTKSMRRVQANAAYQQALRCDPQDFIAHYRLFRSYYDDDRKDLALHHLQQLQDITGRLTILPSVAPGFQAEQDRHNELLNILRADLADAKQQAETKLADGGNRLEVVQQLAESGYVLTALETLEEDLTIISGDPRLTFMYTQLLLEVGRAEEAHNQLQGLKVFADQGALPDWHTVASLGQVIAEDLTGALVTMQQEHLQLVLPATVLMSHMGPLHASGPNGSADDDHKTDPLRTVSQVTRVSKVYFDELLPRLEDNEVRRALINLELGNNGAAETLFRGLAERDPATGWRPIVEMYLSMLTEDSDMPPAPDPDDAGGLVPSLFEDETTTDQATTEKTTGEESTTRDKDTATDESATDNKPGDAAEDSTENAPLPPETEPQDSPETPATADPVTSPNP